MQETDQIKAIADHYGYARQKDKLVEELGELICAIARNDTENIVEEVADVEIMTAQIKHLMGSEKAVEEVKRFKINRTSAIIAEEC